MHGTFKDVQLKSSESKEQPLNKMLPGLLAIMRQSDEYVSIPYRIKRKHKRESREENEE